VLRHVLMQELAACASFADSARLKVACDGASVAAARLRGGVLRAVGGILSKLKRARWLMGRERSADVDDVLIVKHFLKIEDIAKVLQAIILGLLHIAAFDQFKDDFPKVFRCMDAPTIEDGASQHAELFLRV
jgi:hypothetical protein